MQSTSSHNSRRSLLLASFLVWLAPRAARAENSLSYKFESYKEAGGRIAVQTSGSSLEQDLGTDMHLTLDGVTDAITGATPNGIPAPAGSNQVDTSEMRPEHRKSWNATFSRQFPGFNLALGTGNSRESDYVSNGWSINTLTDLNQKNTTLLVGLAGTDDKIKVFYQGPRARKHTNDAIIGVTQLLNPLTSVSFNVTYGRDIGDLNDQYRQVEKDTQVLPGIVLPLTFFENRPTERQKWVGFVGYNRSFPEAHGALDATYRLYHDNFNTTAHTVDLQWFQHVSEKVIVRPGLRFYTQTAANFYYYNLNSTSISPASGPQTGLAPFYASDYRLSAMQTFNYGLKVIWKATERLDFDVALEEYVMHGTDGVTPQSAYPRARIFTVGGKVSW